MIGKLSKIRGEKLLSWRSLHSIYGDMPVVVSYFTDLVYLREAYDLVQSCRLFGLDYVVEQVRDAGSWEENASRKPDFLRTVSSKLQNRPVLWLDADARVRQFPTLLRGLKEPLAYHTWFGSPASGTLYLAAGKQRGELLEQWARTQREQAHHQGVRASEERALREFGDHLELPVEYCWIYDLREETGMSRILSSPGDGDPVVEHMSASRWTEEVPRLSEDLGRVAGLEEAVTVVNAKMGPGTDLERTLKLRASAYAPKE